MKSNLNLVVYGIIAGLVIGTLSGTLSSNNISVMSAFAEKPSEVPPEKFFNDWCVFKGSSLDLDSCHGINGHDDCMKRAKELNGQGIEAVCSKADLT